MQLAQDHKENARRSPWKLLVSGHLEVLKHMGAPCRTPPSQPTGGMGEQALLLSHFADLEAEVWPGYVTREEPSSQLGADLELELISS